MTTPSSSSSISYSNIQLSSDIIKLHQPLFRSWLLLFGIFPIEYDLLSFNKIIDGECFEEKSTMLFIKEWNHHRYLYKQQQDNQQQIQQQQDNSISSSENTTTTSITETTIETSNLVNIEENNNIITNNTEKTLIVDRISFIPRIPGTGFILSFIVKCLFSYRHWRLKMIY